MSKFYNKMYILFFEQLLMLVIALVINKLIAVNLPINFVGNAAINISIASMIFAFSLFGVPSVLLKQLSNSENKQYKQKYLVVALASQMLVNFIINLILLIFLHKVLIIEWIIPYVLLLILDRNIEIMLFSEDKISSNSSVNILSKIIKLTSLLLIISDISLKKYLYIFVIEVLVKVVMKIYILRKSGYEFNNSAFRININRCKEILYQGSSMMLVSFNEMFIEYGDIYIIRFFYGNYLVGIYDRIYQLFKKTLIFNQTLGKLNTQIASNEKNDINDLYNKNSLINIALLLPIITVLIYLSDSIIMVFLTEEYLVGSSVLSFLLLGTLIDSFSRLNGSIIAYRVNMKIISRITLFGALINIILNLILVRSYGILGAAVASTMSHFVMLIFSSIIIVKHKIIDGKIAIRNIIIILIAILMLVLMQFNL